MAGKGLNKKICIQVCALLLANIITHMIGASVFMVLEKRHFDTGINLSATSKSAAEPEPEKETQATVRPSSEPKVEPKAEPTPEPKVEPTPEPKGEPKSEIISKTEPKTEPESEPETGLKTTSADYKLKTLLESWLNSSDLAKANLLLTEIKNYKSTPVHHVPFWKGTYSSESYIRWMCFTAATISTIGYGNIVPQADGSKIFLIPYILISIPLHLCCLAYTGKLIGLILRALIYFIEIKLLKRNEVMNSGMKTLVLMFLLMWIWLFFGTLATMEITEWRFLDSFYFMFVTYTTIGYGDLVIGVASSATYDGMMLLHSIVGLTLVAGVLDRISQGLMTKTKVDIDPGDEQIKKPDIKQCWQ